MGLSRNLKQFLLSTVSDAGLVFDVSGILNGIVNFRRSQRHPLHFAVKSFPDPKLLNKILPALSGADISNLKEYRLLENHVERVDFSTWLTRCPVADLQIILSDGKKKKSLGDSRGGV